MPPPQVHVALPVARTVTDYQIFTARTEAVQSVDIQPRVTGYLTKIEFVDGGEVTENQVLFQIDDRPYKADFDQATANLEMAKAAFVKSQGEYDIGLQVQQQNPGAISVFEMTRRLGARDEAKANVAVAEASLETARLNYDWCQVTSPIAGRANRHMVDVGNLITQNTTTLTNVVSLKPMWAYFDVDENTLLEIQAMVRQGKIESAREHTVPAQMGLGNDTTFPFQGGVDFISNQVDPNTGSMRVRAVFPNDDLALSAGLFGRVRLPIGPPHEALLINDRAIGTDQSQSFILVLNAQDEVEYRAIEIGQAHDGLREVMRYRTTVETEPNGQQITKQVEVLKPDDRVVVDGLQGVRPGVKAMPRMVDMLTLLPVGAPAASPAAESKAAGR